MVVDGQRAAPRGGRIGFAFQAFNLLPHRTVAENVMFGEIYRAGPRAGRRERAMTVLDRVGIANRADFLPTKLSGGQQQRVAIARALVGPPSLLLCDEPTGNLDTANTDAVLALFDELAADGMTFIIVTHDDQVAAHAKRRVRITDGRLSELAA